MGEHALAGMHPVDVATDGVDLTVVGDVAEWMGEVPCGEGIGAVPLMDQCQRTVKPLVRKIGIVLVDLIGQQQALVDKRLRRERTGVGKAPLGKRDRIDLDAKPLADHKQLPFEEIRRRLLSTADEGLTNRRLHIPGALADQRVVDGNIPPAKKPLAFLAADLFKKSLSLTPLVSRRWQENRAQPPLACRRKIDPGLGGDRLEKVLRNLHQDASAVAGERVAACRTAVREILQDLQPLPHDAVALEPMFVDHKAHAAGVVLVERIVEACS